MFINVYDVKDFGAWIHRKHKNLDIGRAYFRKKKHPGTRHFIKKCPFPEKLHFLNLNKKCQKQFLIRGGFDLHLPFWLIQVPICQTKVPFY